jgi:hypothetical protein
VTVAVQDHLRSFAVVAVLLAGLTAGCGEAKPSSSQPEGKPATPAVGETVELDSTAALRQLREAMVAMKRLDAVQISIHNDQGSWDMPLPLRTDIYWTPATGDFRASSRADDPAGDAILEYLHVDDRVYARFQMIEQPPTKWSDVTVNMNQDVSDLSNQWLIGLAAIKPRRAEQTETTTTVQGSMPSGTAIPLLGVDFAGSLLQEAYQGTTAVTIVIENGLPHSLRFSGGDVDLTNVDTAGMGEGMLDGLRAASYSAEYAEGDPADSLTRPAPNEVRRVSAFP